MKGVDSVPETVHHVAYRIDLNQDYSILKSGGGINSVSSIIDNVHKNITTTTTTTTTTGMDVNSLNEEQKSKLIKEIKPQILLGK